MNTTIDIMDKASKGKILFSDDCRCISQFDVVKLERAKVRVIDGRVYLVLSGEK